eukprot:COSAG01_NODE_2363_length_7826_cov_11.548337_1_plen_56_part_00
MYLQPSIARAPPCSRAEVTVDVSRLVEICCRRAQACLHGLARSMKSLSSQILRIR